MSATLLRALLLGLLLSACAVARGAGAPPLWAQVDRVTWGVTPAELQRARQMGWQAYLDAQLHPDPAAPLPPDVQQRIDALSISREDESAVYWDQLARARQIRQLPQDEQVEARREVRRVAGRRAAETAQRSAWRALYSPSQLQELMTWFWMNHFSVYAGKGYIGTVLPSYEDEAIRPHALGRFRDLLGATVRAPAMLIYLDNVRNASGKRNENYARELLELHTLGVDGGYTQHDVQELARVLTGLGIRPDARAPRVPRALRGQLVQDGLFRFDPSRHDRGDKTLLGRHIAGGGLDEVDRVLDLLARHPATARHISRKLAQYFVADRPDEALVRRLSATYLKTDGDIAEVLRALFSSPQFAASLKARKFKDPTQYVYSALRLAYAQGPAVRNPQAVTGLLGRLGQAPNRRVTPDGYPTAQSDWSGSGQMTARFDVAQRIAAMPAPFYREGGPDKDGAPRPRLPAPLPLAHAYGAQPGPFQALSPATRHALAEAGNVRQANAYLLASPEFMRR